MQAREREEEERLKKILVVKASLYTQIEMDSKSFAC